jgi:nickel transport protein
MRRGGVAIALAFLTWVPAGPCFGHGAHCVSIEGGAAVEAVYDGGEPMAFCDVAVFRPGDDREPYVTGSTDPHGRFAFVPDTTGAWKVTVDDGMGHSATADLIVAPDGVPAVGGGHTPDRIRGTLVGVAVIFGLFGLLSLLYRRRREARPCT